MTLFELMFVVDTPTITSTHKKSSVADTSDSLEKLYYVTCKLPPRQKAVERVYV